MLCNYCNTDCSDDLEVCPSCGAPLRTNNIHQEPKASDNQTNTQQVNDVRPSQMQQNESVQPNYSMPSPAATPTTPAKKKSGHGCCLGFAIFFLVMLLLLGGAGFVIYKNVRAMFDSTVSELSEILPFVNSLFDNSSGSSGDPNGSTEFVELEDPSSMKLATAYENGEIDTDTYVKQMLYLTYAPTLMDDAYVSNTPTTTVRDLDSFIADHYEELSESTVNYYFHEVSLCDVTFLPDNEVTGYSIKDPFCDTVYADDTVQNLGNFVVSSNGNFVVWYTPTGNSASSEADAKAIADGLENAVSDYDATFGTSFAFQQSWVTENSKYRQQKKLLEDGGYDGNLLNTAMQVYLLESNDSALAVHTGNPDTALLSTLLWLNGGSPDGSVIFPYITIKPSSFSDIQKLQQLYCHELFHNYQEYYLGSKSQITDPYICEATANWASAKISDSNITEKFLNEWAETAYRKCDSLTTSCETQYSASELSYAHFVFLGAYEACVNDGTNKIVTSIYQPDSYAYLMSQATDAELNEISKYLAYKTLTQDYSNKNYTAAHTMPDRLPISSIQSDCSYQLEDSGRLTLHYYDLGSNSSPFEVTLSSGGSSDYMNAYLITDFNGKYTVVDTVALTTSDAVIDTTAYGTYSTLYLVIANGSWTTNDTYNVSFVGITPPVNPTPSNPAEVTFDTDIKNYRINVTTVLALSNDESLSTTTVSNGIVDQLHQREYLSSTTTVMGMNVSYDIYTDYANGISYTQIPFSNTWDVSYDGAQTVDISKIIDQFNDMGSVEYVSDNCYRVTIPAENLQGSLSTAGNDNSFQLGSGDVTALVYVTGEYITRMEYDFAPLLKGIHQFDVTIEFSDYNNAGDVTIPSGL